MCWKKVSLIDYKKKHTLLLDYCAFLALFREKWGLKCDDKLKELEKTAVGCRKKKS